MPSRSSPESSGTSAPPGSAPSSTGRGSPTTSATSPRPTSTRFSTETMARRLLGRGGERAPRRETLARHGAQRRDVEEMDEAAIDEDSCRPRDEQSERRRLDGTERQQGERHRGARRRGEGELAPGQPQPSGADRERPDEHRPKNKPAGLRVSGADRPERRKQERQEDRVRGKPGEGGKDHRDGAPA